VVRGACIEIRVGEGGGRLSCMMSPKELCRERSTFIPGKDLWRGERVGKRRGEGVGKFKNKSDGDWGKDVL